jgi:hypothetical protein
MSIEELVAVSSPALSTGPGEGRLIPSLLRPLINVRNGFYAFESCLFVRSWGGAVRSAEWWNASDWRNPYGEALAGMWFFAEDVFGFQFAVNDAGFYSFNPETAELRQLATSAMMWAEQILVDYDELTGYSIGHAWQVLNGPIRAGRRLAPAIPFVVGGEYSAAGLRDKPDLELAQFRAYVYAQIKDLPDGAQLRINLM